MQWIIALNMRRHAPFIDSLLGWQNLLIQISAAFLATSLCSGLPSRCERFSVLQGTFSIAASACRHRRGKKFAVPSERSMLPAAACATAVHFSVTHGRLLFPSMACLLGKFAGAAHWCHPTAECQMRCGRSRSDQPVRVATLARICDLLCVRSF